jgi:chromosome segregation ATPase
MGLGVSHGASAQGGVSADREPQGKRSSSGDAKAESTRKTRTQASPDKARDKNRESYDLARLERAVADLVANQDRLVTYIASLEGELERRDDRIADLERSVDQGIELRENATRHLDELIDQLDELEGRIESADSSASTVQPGGG